MSKNINELCSVKATQIEKAPYLGYLGDSTRPCFRFYLGVKGSQKTVNLWTVFVVFGSESVTQDIKNRIYGVMLSLPDRT